jgi:type I restriction enzyme, S subunit
VKTRSSTKQDPVLLGACIRRHNHIIHPGDGVSGTTTFVGLEHIEANTGLRIGSASVDFAKMTGRKPTFKKGQIIYGYLRPYLNKVWIAEFDGCSSVDQFAFEVNEAIADVEYLAHFLRSASFLRQSKIVTTTGQLPRISVDEILAVKLELPPLLRQRRIAASLTAALAAVEQARQAAAARLAAAEALLTAIVRESMNHSGAETLLLGDCLIEIRNGNGATWESLPLLGATRAGLAPAKEAIGKHPERYKLVDCGTVFYNPMRILLGSIAMVDVDDQPGVTSPDYVVVKARPGIMDSRWFYCWFRSHYGMNQIKSLSRGAVRERMLFNRFAAGEFQLPPFVVQRAASERLLHTRRLMPVLGSQLAAIEALPAAYLRQAFGGIESPS